MQKLYTAYPLPFWFMCFAVGVFAGITITILHDLFVPKTEGRRMFDVEEEKRDEG